MTIEVGPAQAAASRPVKIWNEFFTKSFCIERIFVEQLL